MNVSTNLNLVSLAPKYEELGSLYADEFKDKVVVAKVDATANDVPDAITGFPTIKLYAAGNKDEPVEYNGSRTVEDLAAFIKENGKHKVDGLAEGAEKPEQGDDVTASSSSTQAAKTPAASDKEGHDEL